MAQHFNIAAHRQLLHGKQRIDSGSLHLRPADTDKFDSRNTARQRTDQVGAQQIAGSFARNNTDFHLEIFEPV